MRKMSLPQHSITRLLLAWRDGDRAALDKLIPVVEKELRRLARHYMRRQRPGHTLQTSALVNEAYLRLIDYKNMNWQNRAHFFAMAAQAMRRVLVDHARSKNYAKRGGGAQRVHLDEAELTVEGKAKDIVELDDALMAFEKIDKRKSQIVEMRYFAGMSLEETAEALGVSPITVIREWNAAKRWLLRELSNIESNDARAVEKDR
jgi:RNA polymerase sigma factor (TIGR02999 family)